MLSNTRFSNDIRKAAIAEVKQPLILKAGKIFDTIDRQNPFTKNRNRPRVSKVMGIVRITMNGLMKILTRARSAAVIIAVGKSST
jgi:hypothetical protein